MGTATIRSSHTFMGEGVGLTEGEISALPILPVLTRRYRVDSGEEDRGPETVSLIFIKLYALPKRRFG